MTYQCFTVSVIYFILTMAFMSYNVKGQNSIRKRWLALKEFKAFQANVIFVQETHFHEGVLSSLL